jgi:hypothetical protein
MNRLEEFDQNQAGAKANRAQADPAPASAAAAALLSGSQFHDSTAPPRVAETNAGDARQHVDPDRFTTECEDLVRPLEAPPGTRDRRKPEVSESAAEASCVCFGRGDEDVEILRVSLPTVRRHGESADHHEPDAMPQ